MTRSKDPIENLLTGVERLYQDYRTEEADWGELSRQIEELGKTAKRIRRTQAKAREGGKGLPEIIENVKWPRA